VKKFAMYSNEVLKIFNVGGRLATNGVGGG
jgi:hypothetical protein